MVEIYSLYLSLVPPPFLSHAGVQKSITCDIYSHHHLKPQENPTELEYRKYIP